MLVTCFIDTLILYSKLNIIKKDIRRRPTLAEISNQTSISISNERSLVLKLKTYEKKTK